MRTGLMVLVAVAILPLLGLALYTNLSERRLDASEFGARVLQLTRLAAASQEHVLEGTRQLLIALTQTVTANHRDAPGCSDFLAHLVKQYPYYAFFGTVDVDGNLECSSLAVDSPTNVSDRAWFQRAIQARDLDVGGYEPGPVISQATIHVSYPIFDPDGQVLGLVFAGLALGHIDLFETAAALQPQSVVMLVDGEGIILARYPDPENWVGRSLAETSVVEGIVGQGEGEVVLADADGVQRMYAVTPLHRKVATGVFLGIGIPTGVSFAKGVSIFHRNLTGLALAGALALIAAWVAGDRFILRRVSVLLALTQQLATGDLSARSGMRSERDELGELARAFDEMATSLELRTAQLRQAEERYRTMVEKIPAVTYTAPLEGRGSILYVSPQIEAMLGFAVEQWQADPGLWDRQLHPDDRERVLAELVHCQATRTPFCCEYRLLTSNGEVVWVSDEALVECDPSGQFCSRQGLMLNITERRAAQEKLLAYQRQLRSLASQLSLAEERERRRIATDLHDQIGQKLAIAKIKLGALRASVENDAVAESLGEVRGLVEESIQEARSLIYRISSPILYELGFEAAVEWLSERTQAQHGLIARCLDDGQPKPLDDDVKVLLFRVVSELLMNVVKHAEAQEVNVSLQREDDHILIVVEDNGVGFDVSQLDIQWREGAGFGLFSIRERLQPLGGRLEITSASGQGTQVVIMAPLKVDESSKKEKSG